jgi:hypothetical protein
MHGTVTYSAGSLGWRRTKLLLGFVRNGVGLLARAIVGVTSEWEMYLQKLSRHIRDDQTHRLLAKSYRVLSDKTLYVNPNLFRAFLIVSP